MLVRISLQASGACSHFQRRSIVQVSNWSPSMSVRVLHLGLYQGFPTSLLPFAGPDRFRKVWVEVVGTCWVSWMKCDGQSVYFKFSLVHSSLVVLVHVFELRQSTSACSLPCSDSPSVSSNHSHVSLLVCVCLQWYNRFLSIAEYMVFVDLQL